MSYWAHIRIDDNLQNSIQMVQQFGKYVIVSEIASISNKEHCHAVVETSYNQNYISQVVHKVYPGSKSSVKKVKDINKLMPYIMKDLKSLEELHHSKEWLFHESSLLEWFHETQLINEDKKSNKKRSFTERLILDFDPESPAFLYRKEVDYPDMQNKRITIVEHIQAHQKKFYHIMDRTLFQRFFYAIYNHYYQEDCKEVYIRWTECLDL